MFRNDIVSQYHTLPREDVRFEKYRSWFLVYGVMCSELLSGCRCPVLLRLKEQYDCTLLHEEDAYVKSCQLWNMCVTISSIIIIFRGHEVNWLLMILSLSCLYNSSLHIHHVISLICELLKAVRACSYISIILHQGISRKGLDTRIENTRSVICSILLYSILWITVSKLMIYTETKVVQIERKNCTSALKYITKLQNCKIVTKF